MENYDKIQNVLLSVQGRYFQYFIGSQILITDYIEWNFCVLPVHEIQKALTKKL